MEEQIFTVSGELLRYSYLEIILGMMLSFILGIIISKVYIYTHKGLSYSQSFTLTILFLTVIVSIVMMVIGGSLSRAFALVGAMSIIRFRTVIKDTKDTAFIFIGLAVGMAAGTANYFLAISGTFFVCFMAIILHKTNFGALYKSEFIVRFMFDQNFDNKSYIDILSENTKSFNMLHIEPFPDSNTVKYTYDVTLLSGGSSVDDIINKLNKLDGMSEIVMISSKSDVDY